MASLLLCSSLVSCVNAASKGSTFAVERGTDRCRTDTAHSYEVFIPERSNANQTFPLLVVLDPHGSGRTALQHFLLAAERYPTVVVASNRIKNNLAGYEADILTLIDDVRAKYPVSSVLFLSGFSGGARMALGYALNHPTNGLVLSGALAGEQALRQIGCPIYSISGTDDFNFMETAPYLFQEQPSNLKMELIRSSHDWPDSLTLAEAIGFIHLAATAEPDPNVLKAFEQRQSTKIDRLKTKGSYLMARCLTRNLAQTSPFSTDPSFASMDSQLKASASYTDELKRLMENLRMESSVREGYLQAFDTHDATWWKDEQAKVDKSIETSTDPFVQDAYKRIKGFWGIVCYSLCNKAVASNDYQALKRYVAIYRILEPQNPDMLRFAEMLPR